VHLTVLGSGSRGNAIVLQSQGRALLADAGFGLRELERRLDAARVERGTIRAIVLTHEHGDHARGAARAAARWGVPLAATAGTLARLAAALDGVATLTLPPARAAAVDVFAVTAYPTAHDAAEPAMLVVEAPDGRRAGIALDVGSPTAALHHACRDLDALVVEANHDEVLLRASGYPPSVRARIAGRGGHLANTQTGTLLAEVAHASLGLVVLAHLSEQCNRPEAALRAVRAALAGTAFRGRLVVAAQDAPSPTLAVGAALEQLVLPLSRAG
jgi:phosphoribosyl 1,2-cyclic phosphodiesterase